MIEMVVGPLAFFCIAFAAAMIRYAYLADSYKFEAARQKTHAEYWEQQAAASQAKLKAIQDVVLGVKK